MPSPESGKQWPAAVADEEHAVLGRRAQLVREPVALVADRRHADPRGDLARRLLDVVARLVGADADALLAVRGHRPRVAAPDQRAVDPDVEVDAAALGVDLEAARDARLGRLDVGARAEHAAPAERVDDQRRAQRAAVGVDGVALAALDLRHLEARVALLPQLLAQRPVVERRPAPRQPVARRAVRRVEAHALELLAGGAADAHRLEPRRRDRAGAGLALADLVAVDDEHVGAAARQLARDRQPGEARAADQHVGALVERRALLAPQGRAARHRRSAASATSGSCQAGSRGRRPSTS